MNQKQNAMFRTCSLFKADVFATLATGTIMIYNVLYERKAT